MNLSIVDEYLNGKKHNPMWINDEKTGFIKLMLMEGRLFNVGENPYYMISMTEKEWQEIGEDTQLDMTKLILKDLYKLNSFKEDK